jgi:hypothetical protein
MSARRVTTLLPCGYSSQQVDWSPENLDSGILTAWYKADSISGSDGDPVSAWVDSSGNGHDVAQATAIRQPTLQTNELNSKPVVRFDGANDIISDGDISDLDVGTGDIWMACLFKSNDNSALQNIFEKGDTSYGLRVLANGNLQMVMGSTTFAPFQNSGNWSRTEFVLMTASRVSNTNTGFINGSAADTTGTTDNGSISNANVLDIGSRTIGAGVMTGDIAELLLGGSTLSTADRQKIEGYLAHRYGLESNLPKAHPYRSQAPKA